MAEVGGCGLPSNQAPPRSALGSGVRQEGGELVTPMSIHLALNIEKHAHSVILSSISGCLLN